MLKKMIFPFICMLLAGCSSAIISLATPSPTVDFETLPPSLFHFASQRCFAPCWQGITPATTDKASAEGIMDGLIRYSVIGKNMRFYNGYAENGYSVQLIYRGEKVYLTRIYLSENVPSLREVIDFLGAPDLVCLLIGEITDNDPEYETDILYLNRGVWLSSSQAFQEKENKGQLHPDLKLNEITFFRPEEDFELLEGDRTKKILRCASKWEGYVGYQIQSKY